MVKSCQVMDNAGRLVEAPKNNSGSFTMQVIHLACEHPMKFMTEIRVCLKRGKECFSKLDVPYYHDHFHEIHDHFPYYWYTIFFNFPTNQD